MSHTNPLTCVEVLEDIMKRVEDGNRFKGMSDETNR